MKEVAAAIIVNQGKILIAKRGIGEKMEGKWEFPGGKLEEGETGEEALAREIREELEVEVKAEEFFMESIYGYSFGEIKLLCYKASGSNYNFKLNVHSEVKWVKPSEILAYDFAPADIPVAQKIYSLGSTF